MWRGRRCARGITCPPFHVARDTDNAAVSSEPSITDRSPRERYVLLARLGLVVLVGVVLRAHDLGVRSLWADEFCTWHVSRMPLGESIRWRPELTQPPLYQLILRFLTDDARPSESMLRLPALLAGILSIVAAFQLAARTADRRVALALAALFSVNLFQIRYSQEARPYTLLVLGAILTTSMWLQVHRSPRVWKVGLYVLAAVAAFHSHYLIVLTLAGQWGWSIVRGLRSDRRTMMRYSLPSMVAIVGLCAPMAVHFIHHRASNLEAVNWIPPPTWLGALDALGAITFGRWWVGLLLLPACGVWFWAARRRASDATATCRSERIAPRSDDLLPLLLWWLAAAWGGLLIISWIAHPAMVGRYAIAAALPAMLIPLVVAERIHARLLLLVAVVFFALGLQQSLTRATTPDFGFREMSAYLASTATDSDLIVLAIDNRTHPDWDDAERLCFQYYRVPGHEIAELHIAPDGRSVENDVLFDPRAVYLVVLWSDPFPIIAALGRESEPFVVDGVQYSQLLFSPYRLVKIKAKSNGA